MARDQAVWGKLVERGFIDIAGVSQAVILSAYNNMSQREVHNINHYGNGTAAKCIVNQVVICD